jgi:hypothetical protein
MRDSSLFGFIQPEARIIVVGLLTAILMALPLLFSTGGISVYNSGGMISAYTQLDSTSSEEGAEQITTTPESRQDNSNVDENGLNDTTEDSENSAEDTDAQSSNNNLDIRATKPSQELTKLWWRWIAVIPEERNPVTDTTGEDCRRGNFGAIFFLAGTTGGDEITRECTIREGQTILIPILNALCVKELPEETEESLNALCNDFLDNPTTLQLSIDGQEIENLEDNRVKVMSFFRFGTVPNNILGIDAGFYRAIADGYWVLLRGGLPEGEHTLEIVGEVEGFRVAVDYRLTVT